MQADKFIRRAQEFVGSEGNVDRVVVVQQRPLWAMVVAFAAFIALAILLNVIGISSVVIVGVFGGAAMVAAYTAMTKTFYLVGVEGHVQVLKLETWTGKPEFVMKTLTRPLDAGISKGIVNKSVQIDGESYILSRLYGAEFTALATH